MIEPAWPAQTSASEASEASEASARPCRADGLALLDEFAGSGLARPVFLARRADGQVVTLTELLARIVEAADGTRDLAAIADHAGRRCARAVNGADVAYLLTNQLMPLGLIAAPTGVTPAPRANSLLTLAGRRTLLPASAVHRISGVFAMLFRPAAVAVLLALLLAADAWLFGRHSVRDSAAMALATPSMILLLVGLTLVCALFHECGHAAACRYGGARPGVIGVGMYLVWPAFFTDVTDSYRLSRWGRLRTDLGGIYFNGLFALLLIGTFALTRAEVLVTAALLVHMDALRQLAPFVRLDGYYIVSDLVGVPDLFSRMGPAVRSAWRAAALVIPSRRRARADVGSAPDPGLAGLTRRARVLVTAWALCVAPMIAVNLVMLVVYVPFVLPRTASAVRDEFGQASRALADGELVAALAAAIGVVLVALPTAGMIFVLVRLGRRVVRVMRARPMSRRRPGPGRPGLGVPPTVPRRSRAARR
jgi:putative peptide zinc metalloprotease protein